MSAAAVNYPYTPANEFLNGQARAPDDVAQQSRKQLSSPDEDPMLLARAGDISGLQRLFDSGRCDASYRDEEGITPLHWAALNNQYEASHFLISVGADVNAKGGTIAATPAMWAVRNCNYYVVDLLLQNGADPLKTDDQGFNLLQNASMDGNVFQVIMLLHHDVHVDIADPKGHTPLMWAAYKGFPACIEALLQWGASVSAKDEQGFTALHWALVRGHRGCIQKLIEAGSDKFARTLDQKTPAVVAEEMKSQREWHGALADCGYQKDATPQQWPLTPLVKDRRTFLTRFFFLWPFLIVLCCTYIIAWMPILFAVPLAMVTSALLQQVAKVALRWAPQKSIGHTSFVAGIFAGALFWLGIRFVVKIVWSSMAVAPLSSMLFLVLYSCCCYFYFLSMAEDPGYIARTSSRIEQKHLIRTLLDTKRFDEQSFCIMCSIRKPLRSRHCRRCNRCVAKQDHHCPWVYNCIGVNNHRHFLLYLMNMWVGMLFGDIAIFQYLKALPRSEINDCAFLSEELCITLNKDPFTIVLATFCSLNMIWVTMLMSVQLINIARGLTTRENMHSHHLHGMASTMTAAITAGTTSADAAELQDRIAPVNATNAVSQRPTSSVLKSWWTLFGLDTFVATVTGKRNDGVTEKRRNPFTRGCLTNYRDFFCDATPAFRPRSNGTALLGGEVVDYTNLYEAPSRRWTRIAPVEGPGGVSYQSVTTEETYDD